MSPRKKRRAPTPTSIRRSSRLPKKIKQDERDEDNEQQDVAVDDVNVNVVIDPVEESDSTTESGTESEDCDKRKISGIVAGKSGGNSQDSGSGRKLKVDKAAMAFPKGTFVVRLTDVANSDSKWIWRIDNHQLIHKYVLDETSVIHQHGSSRRYIKSFRYSGWFCDEKWNFVELNVLDREDKEECVEVEFPTEYALEAAKNVALVENQKCQITSASG